MREDDMEIEQVIDHAVHECLRCNQKLTDIFIHHKQVNCNHIWKKLTKTTKGCNKCLLTKELK